MRQTLCQKLSYPLPHLVLPDPLEVGSTDALKVGTNTSKDCPQVPGEKRGWVRNPEPCGLELVLSATVESLPTLCIKINKIQVPQTLRTPSSHGWRSVHVHAHVQSSLHC